MTREQQLSIANEVLPILHAYNANGQAKADPDLRQKVKQLYSSITAIFNVDVNCNHCLLHFLNVILSWKERVDKEIAAEQANQPKPEPVTEEPVQESKPEQEVQEPEAKEEPKKKGKKKNN